MAAVPNEKGKEDKKSIVFFHPDLGIGGAERLVIDAAVGLQELGHKVTIFTSYCDKKHCFEEARDGKYLLNTPWQCAEKAQAEPSLSLKALSMFAFVAPSSPRPSQVASAFYAPFSASSIWSSWSPFSLPSSTS